MVSSGKLKGEFGDTPRISDKPRRLEGMASGYTNLGNVLQAWGDRDGAEEMYRQATDLAENLGFVDLVAKAK